MNPAAQGRHVLLAYPCGGRRRALEAMLRERGYRVSVFDLPDQVLAALADRQLPDLLLLGAEGPPGHRLATLQRVRRIADLPVMVIGALGERPGEGVLALEAGADDYVAPSTPAVELVARVGALLRRAQRASPAPPAGAIAAPSPARVIAGGWRLATMRRQLVAADGGASIPLTGAEFDMLRLLEQADGWPVDRETVSRLVFRRPWTVTDRAVDGLVKRLRRKLPADAIASVRGVGYALRFDDGPVAGGSETSAAVGRDAKVEFCVPSKVVSSTTIQSEVVSRQALHRVAGTRRTEG